MRNSTKIIWIILIILIISVALYWYFFFYGPGNQIEPIVNDPNTPSGFVPLNSNNPTNSPVSTTEPDIDSATTTNNGLDLQTIEGTLPKLRLLSNTPIGGYGASTTASTTVVRWIDRGRGNILEAKGDSGEIVILSNTLLPRMYEGVWNKNITAFIGSLINNNADTPTTVYAKLYSQASTTSKVATSTAIATTTDERNANVTPYYIKGKNLPENIIDYAVSPGGDKVFLLIKESGQGVGYVANFDGTKLIQIFNQPLTEVNVDWPEENTLTIVTKGSANHQGFLYFVNAKTGIWQKVLGPIYGLSAKVSRDAKHILVSTINADKEPVIKIYKVGTSAPIDTMIRTLADKCVWGNNYKELVYCAVPSNTENATYPDDWYKGSVDFSDKILQYNTKDETISVVSPILDQTDRLIDAFNLGVDDRDDFLFFMNKHDLSFWSLDLSAE